LETRLGGLERDMRSWGQAVKRAFNAFDFAGDCFLEFFWVCMLHLGWHLASKSMVLGLQRERSIEIH